jgi:hypothetical protein
MVIAGDEDVSDEGELGTDELGGDDGWLVTGVVGGGTEACEVEVGEPGRVDGPDGAVKPLELDEDEELELELDELDELELVAAAASASLLVDVPVGLPGVGVNTDEVPTGGVAL